jgi:hypothetical protein
MLCSHNDALARYVALASAVGTNLECHLSAYCTALRIRFYLWRMIKPNPMCHLRTYERQFKGEYFCSYCDQLSNLATQEFGRVQSPPLELFQDVKRELVSEPVRVEFVSRALDTTASEFCTICQHDHMGPECVSPLNCSCVFGRDCLQPLLNRDMPSSYTCPNCRTRLHEPLEWKPIASNGACDISVGLLWALRANIACLHCELNSDPNPFTLRQRVARLFDRIVY